VRERVVADFKENERRRRFVELGHVLRTQFEARLKAGDSFDKAAAATDFSTAPKTNRVSLPAHEVIQQIEHAGAWLALHNIQNDELYRTLVDEVRKVESEKAGSAKLAEAVARGYAKLLAYKDEYEVARLHSDGEFARKIVNMFEGDYRLVYHLSPPLLARIDPASGEPRKMRFGPWMLPVFRILARLRRLRGTRLDIFGRSEERRLERRLIGEYEALVDEILDRLSPANHEVAVELASLPDEIRGFGHVKEANLARVKAREETLLAQFRSAPMQALAAE